MSYDLDDVREQVESGEAVLADVRELEEWNEGRVAQAVLAPLSAIDTGTDPDLDRTKTVYTYCRAGGRSFMARDLLVARGWTNIVPLNEGFEELCARGFTRA